LKNGHWTVPENIGFPLNSSGDDIFFSWNKDLSVVYFSSHRDDSYGDKDLYMGTLTAIKQKNQIMTDAAKHDSTTISNFQQIISGKVYDRTNTNEPAVYLFNPKNHLIKIEPDSGKFFRYKSLPYDDHKIVFESPFIKDNASAQALPDSNDTYNHKPLHKVFVYLLNPQNEVIKETTSDTNGYFSFKDLPPLDAYKLVLSKPEEQKSLNKNHIRSSVSAAAVINMGDTVHNGYVYYGQVNNGSYSPNSKIFIADSASSKPFTQPNKDGYFAFVKIPHLNFEVKLKDDGLLTLQSTRIPTDCCLFVPRHVIPKFKYGKLPADTNVISLNYVIHGKVISKTGEKPLHDISLLLIDNNGNVVDKVITDHEGRFRFVKLKPDHYYVLFEHYDPTLKAVLTEDKDDLKKQKKHVIKSSMSNALVHDHDISTVYHPNENIIHIFKDSLLELKSQNPEKKYTEFVLGYVLIKKTNGPAAIVHVYLLNRNNELIAIATTDKNGIFCFRDLPPANYKIAFPVNYPTVKAEIDYTLSDYDILSDKAIPEGKKNLIVYGKVDLNGKSTSLENTIYLIDDQGHIIKTISDKDGHFAFTRINNLNYSIIIELYDSCLYVPKTTVAKFRYHRIEKKGNIKVPDYILYGKITAKTGTAPLKDISMLLIDHNGNIIDKTKTNEEGHFKFHRLQLDDHYVVFESQNPNLKAELRFPVDNNQLVLNSNRHYINFKTYFEYNSVELSDSSQLILDQVYQEVKNSNKGKLYIYTYADPIGSRQYNINLSLQRANRIKKYLIQKGLAVSKITIYPKGSANLMIYSADKNVNRLNRRAEFEVE
jgi:outer membrane protein OmpA-like peptidoglycan-associated protein